MLLALIPGVGFEPTQISLTVLKTVALNHSAILVLCHYYDTKPGVICREWDLNPRAFLHYDLNVAP